MAILKNKTQGNFVIISQSITHDSNLSLTERGLLLTLLSLPDGWNLSVAGLQKILPDGKDRISNALNGLIELGYVTREQGRANGGKFSSNILEVHDIPVREDPRDELPNDELSKDDSPKVDSPLTGFPSTVNPQTDNPSAGNPLQVNNKYINNNNTSINNKTNNNECIRDTLNNQDYDSLVNEFGKEVVDSQIERIKNNHYKGCMNYQTIHEWCKERKNRGTVNLVPFKKQAFNQGCQSRNYTEEELSEIEGALFFGKGVV